MYKVLYTGCGRIEVDLPSYPSGVTILHNQYARLNLSEADKRVIRTLRNLGLSYELIEEKPAVKAVDPEEPVIVVNAPADKELVADTSVPTVEESKPQYTKDELMRKTAGDLKGILKDLGATDFDKKSKSEMSDMILEITK